PFSGLELGRTHPPPAPTPLVHLDGNINVELTQFRAVATRYDKHGYVYLGTVTAAALLIRLRS
ncbi:hypothetical protein ACFV0W_37645, partial [Streptomyces anulatus]